MATSPGPLPSPGGSKRCSPKAGAARLAPVQRGALDAIGLKLGRILSGDPGHADRWRDLAGHAWLAANEDGARSGRPATALRRIPPETLDGPALRAASLIVRDLINERPTRNYFRITWCRKKHFLQHGILA